MIRINLLPFRAARTKENVRRQISIVFLIIVMMLVSMAGISINLSMQESQAKEKVTACKLDLDTYTKKAKEVDAINKENEMLQKKIDIINDLERVRKEPIVLLSALTDMIVEERMWLTNFEIKDKDVSIKGMALDEITVADFAKRLQSSPLYSEIVLKNLKQTIINNIKMKTFEITGTITRINEKKPDTTSKALK